MRKTFIAGNWKMHKTIEEGVELANSLKRGLYEVEGVDIAICPSYTLLGFIADTLEESNIGLGAQDVFWEEEGAYTGEVSARMLKDAGCGFVIIGHSERRQYFGETNDSVNKKIKAALENDLCPIVCVGETLAQRESGKTFAVLEDHINNGLAGICRDSILCCPCKDDTGTGFKPAPTGYPVGADGGSPALVIAYEPVWAIGTGKTASSAQAQEAHKFIRGLLSKLWGNEISGSVRIQYGGSVKPENISELMQQPDVDGALVGGASLKAESFVDIVKKANGVNKT